MKRMLVLLILSCGPKLAPHEIINLAERCYQKLNSYQDQFVIDVTKIRKGTKTTYSIVGQTYYRRQGTLLLDIQSPVKFRICVDDSITYYNREENNYYRCQKPEIVKYADLQFMRFLKDKISISVVKFLLEKTAGIVERVSNDYTLNYRGTRWEDGRMVYKLIATCGVENIEWTIDCKSGVIYKIRTTSEGSDSIRLLVEEVYTPSLNVEFGDTVFNFELPLSAVRISD